MRSILDMVTAHVDSHVLEYIGRQLECHRRTAASAVRSAVATLIASLASNTDDPSEATALFHALDDHKGDLDTLESTVGDPLASMMAGHAPPRNGGGLNSLLPAATGEALLTRIFGRREPDAESGIARATSLTEQQVRQLLLFLAPVVMGVLSRRKDQGMDEAGLKRDLAASASESLQPHQPSELAEILGAFFQRVRLA